MKTGDKEILKSGEAIGPSGLEGVVGGLDLEAQVVDDGPPASPEFSGKRKREESAEAPRPHKTAKFEHEVEAVSSLEPVLMPSIASEDANEQQQCQKYGEKLLEDNEEPKAKEDTYRPHCHYGLKSPVCSQCDKDERRCQICENIIPREELMDGYILINESRFCVEYDEDLPICEGCADELIGARMITVTTKTTMRYSSLEDIQIIPIVLTLLSVCVRRAWMQMRAQTKEVLSPWSMTKLRSEVRPRIYEQGGRTRRCRQKV